jgi:plasmid stabilization system protein ParE
LDSGWSLALTRPARSDIQKIIGFTRLHFGTLQAECYRAALSRRIASLGEGPGVIGLKARPELGAGCHTLRMAQGGKQARHVLVVQVDAANRCIIVLRVLHESMWPSARQPGHAALSTGCHIPRSLQLWPAAPPFQGRGAGHVA